MDRKEAIEVIKKNYPHVGFSGSEFETALRELVPELKESEDERIRKELYEFIKVNSPTEDANRFIAWLEKQKEQKPVEIHIDNPNIQKYDDVKISTSDSSASGDELLYVCNKSYNIGFRDGVASVKPAEHPEKGNEYWFGFNEGKGTVLDNPEQFGLYKPAEWSEEDLQHKSWILECLADGEKKMPEYAEDFQAAYKWLKSLRPQPKHKQEEIVLCWEKGHPEPYKSVLILRHGNVVVEGEWNEGMGRWYQYGFKCYLEDNEVDGWMNKKSLLSGNSTFQPQWKPSEEQIGALERAIVKTHTVDDIGILAELRDNLKKL